METLANIIGAIIMVVVVGGMTLFLLALLATFSKVLACIAGIMFLPAILLSAFDIITQE